MRIKYYLIFIFLYGSYSTNAQSNHYLDSARKYSSREEYLKASVFCERIFFESQNEKEIEKAFLLKIDLLKVQKLYSQAIQFIKQNLSLVQGDSTKYMIYEQWIICSYMDNQYSETVYLIELSEKYFPLYVNYKWLSFLKILSLNYQNQWQEAKQTCKNLLINLKLDSTIVESIYRNPPHLKSENTASWLATIIPGAGQIYTRNYGEAFSSIILQSLGIIYGVNSFQNNYFLSSWLVGLGTFGSFHNGGVRRSVELVKQYNIKKSYHYNNQIKLSLIEALNYKMY